MVVVYFVSYAATDISKRFKGSKGEDLKFKHDLMTRFGLDQDHRALACSKCHDPTNWKTKGTAGANCHPNKF